jgi:hypothetical protein
MVEQMAKDWERFKKFVLHADWRDSGAEAAEQYLSTLVNWFVCCLRSQMTLIGHRNHKAGKGSTPG